MVLILKVMQFSETLNLLNQTALFDPASRLWIGFVFSSVLLAFLFSRNTGFTKLFDKKLYTSDSAKIDYLFAFLGYFIKLVALVPKTFAIGGIAALTSGTLNIIFSEFTGAVALDHWYLITFSIIYFIWDDFTRWVLHMLQHRVPLLWKFHQVHHSAEQLNFVTLHRTHPIEVIMGQLRSVLSIGSLTGLFVYLNMTSAPIYEVLGIQLLSFLFNLLGANLRHSPVYLSFGKIEHIIISPAQHQIHHSTLNKHHDSNYGAFLSIWDKLAGKLILSKHHSEVKFGLPNTMLLSKQKFFTQLLGPFKKGQSIHS